MLRQSDFEKGQLVLEGWRRGKEYGGHLASVLIMNIIANRVRLGWGSWLDVIERVPLYTADSTVYIGYPLIWDANFVRLLHEVESIFDGSAKDPTNGALYWADLRKIDRQWFKDKILGQPDVHPRIGDMNSLTLFK